MPLWLYMAINSAMMGIASACFALNVFESTILDNIIAGMIMLWCIVTSILRGLLWGC